MKKLSACLVPLALWGGLAHSLALISDQQKTVIEANINSETNEPMPFQTHREALALNVVYAPIKALRDPIKTAIARRESLNFLKSWRRKGEAHVTVITPPELAVLSAHNRLSMNEINQIALDYNIQESDLSVYGIGHGIKQIGTPKQPQEAETFFVLVDSLKLRKIRMEIYKAFVKKGGSKNAWDPNWFFPHITIGYTKDSDIFEPDVYKDILHSWDLRFN